MQGVPDSLWLWIRSDLDDQGFETWLYSNSVEVERCLGQRACFDLLELDFRDAYAVAAAKGRLLSRLPRTCLCPLMHDRQVLPLTFATRATRDSPFLARFERTSRVADGTELWTCRRCGLRWFVAVDSERDLWFLRRVPKDSQELPTASDAQAGAMLGPDDHLPHVREHMSLDGFRRGIASTLLDDEYGV